MGPLTVKKAGQGQTLGQVGLAAGNGGRGKTRQDRRGYSEELESWKANRNPVLMSQEAWFCGTRRVSARSFLHRGVRMETGLEEDRDGPGKALWASASRCSVYKPVPPRRHPQ